MSQGSAPEGGFRLPHDVRLTALEEELIDEVLAAELLLGLLRHFQLKWNRDICHAAHAYAAYCLIRKLEQPIASSASPEASAPFSPEIRALLGED